MQIGLTLSGGGFRATAFHLGVLSRLAIHGLLEEVTFVSTVSGGTLCAGLIFAACGYQWPSSRQFLESVLPKAYRLLTETDLQGSLIIRAFYTLGLLRSRAPALAKLLRRFWGIDASLRDLPSTPRWIINATCYETGKNWRFERKRMGDYVFGYEIEPDFPIAEAMAASAGYPGLIGSLTLHTNGRIWVRYTGTGESIGDTETIQPEFSEVHLWDGGVYDNLGVEPLFKPNGGYRPGIDLLVVSDASGLLSSQRYGSLWMVPQAFRLVGIAMGQVRSLRARTLIKHFAQPGQPGCYMRLGNSVDEILYRAKREEDVMQYPDAFLPKVDVQRLGKMETNIRRMLPFKFNLLYRHGFEVANATLFAYLPEQFSLAKYPPPSWSHELQL